MHSSFDSDSTNFYELVIQYKFYNTQRVITGTVRSTPTQWLPVLSNIEPPSVRHEAVAAKLLNRIQGNQSLPLTSDVYNHPAKRLVSRHPIWESLPPTDSTPSERWREMWASDPPRNNHLMEDPAEGVAGMDLNRKSWCLLNRFRTNHGRCRASEARWGSRSSPLCQCG